MMKRACCIFLAVLLLLACAGCEASDTPIEGSVEELLEKVARDTVDPEVSLVTAQAAEENFNWYFFIDPIEGAEGWVSEPVIGSIPHCIGLLRLPEGVDAEQVRAEIEENLNPRKWVCVEAEETAVIRRGDLILVALSDSGGVAKAKENFQALQ